MTNQPQQKDSLCSVKKEFNPIPECETFIGESELALVHKWRSVLTSVPKCFPYTVTLYDHYISMRLSETDELTIEKRPRHCNRGRYLVKVYNQSPVTPFYVDDQDNFPRYYFGEEAMMSEIQAWIETHKK